MVKKRGVPEVLWRLFRHRARTLAQTILSLISLAAECRCKRRRCLFGSGGDAMTFLLRSDDNCDYRKLLTQCFVVVDLDSPPLSNFFHRSRWSQHQIVQRTMENLRCEETDSSNVILSSYNKCNQSSPNFELLTCSAWCLLLERVGDNVMVYLLKHTSIFLPLPRKKHHQVAGPPISDLCIKLRKHTSEALSKHPSVFFGSQQSCDENDVVKSTVERQQPCSSSSVSGPLGSVSDVGYKTRKCTRQFSGHCWREHSQIKFSEAATSTSGSGNVIIQDHSNGDKQNSAQNMTKLKKRLRPFRWQRCRKRRHLNFEENNVKSPSTITCIDEDSLPRSVQCNSKTSLTCHQEKMQRQCACCLMSRALQDVPKEVQVNRKPMFYNLEISSSVFPREHVLNSLKPNYAGSKFLIRNIFGFSDVDVSAQSCFHRSGLYLSGSACLYHSLIKLLKIFIRKTQCCQHLRLLEKHCVVPSWNQNASSKLEANKSSYKVLNGSHTNHHKTVEATHSQFEETKLFCSKSQVVSFIWAVCRSIIPPELLGTPSNWRILQRNISKFIQLRRFEKFSGKQCVHKLKTSQFSFLSNKYFFCCLNYQAPEYCSEQDVPIMHKRFSRLNDDGEYIMKQKLLERWISWLFSFVVVPVVQANFYVTESEYGKQDVYYYQKRIWDRLTNKAITCLKDQRYQYLDDSVVRNILSKRSFGFSKLRIRPKENGVRVLANLKVSCKMKVEKSSLENNSRGACKTMKMFPKRVKFNYFKSVNCALRDSHAVLKSLRLKEPEKLGASVFDYNDVYRKLCPFLVGLKNRTLINPETFIVVADVSKAFDSVVQDKLMSVMKDVLQEETYLLKQYHEVVCMKKSLWVHENIVLTDQENSTISPEVISSFLFRSLPSVLVNQESNRYVNVEELFFNLKELVKSNILQLDKKFYLQGLGIPQGSSMSSLLCSLYYGDLERNVIFPFLEKCLHSQSKGIATINSPSCNYMLLRFIDDFLFVSTSRKQAASFFSRLKRGFRDYNCFMNEDKFCVNFDIGHISGHPQKRVYMGEDGISFLRWSGLLINCRNLEIQADYTKYLNNHLSSTLTVCWHGKPGRHLKEKLCAFMRPKCHPIFFDSNINSPSVVRLNIYQAFLLCAMKFHCYVCNLSYICKLQPRFYSHIIERSLRYMFVLIERRMQSLHLGSDLHPVLELDEGEVTWLGLNAFIKILKRKQSRHRELLSMLRSKLLRHRIASNESSQLNYAVDDSHSSLFWKIKY